MKVFLRSKCTCSGSDTWNCNSILINLSIRKAFPVLYHIPWVALFGGIFVLIGIVFFITRAEIHKLRDKSIIDEIRMDIV